MKIPAKSNTYTTRLSMSQSFDLNGGTLVHFFQQKKVICFINSNFLNMMYFWVSLVMDEERFHALPTLLILLIFAKRWSRYLICHDAFRHCLRRWPSHWSNLDFGEKIDIIGKTHTFWNGMNPTFTWDTKIYYLAWYKFDQCAPLYNNAWGFPYNQ